MLPLSIALTRTVLRRQRPLQHLLHQRDPLVAIAFAGRRQIVRALRRAQRKAEALILGAGLRPHSYAVALDVVPQKDLALRVRVQRLVVVHQLAIVQREPAPLVAVRRTWTGFRQPTLFGEVARQQADQLPLAGRRIGDLQPMQFRAPNRHVPVVDRLLVVVVHVDVTRRAVLHVRQLHTVGMTEFARRERHVQLADAQHRLRVARLLHMVLDGVVRLGQDELARLVALVLFALLHQEALHVTGRVAGPVVHGELEPIVFGANPLFDEHPVGCGRVRVSDKRVRLV